MTLNIPTEKKFEVVVGFEENHPQNRSGVAWKRNFLMTFGEMQRLESMDPHLKIRAIPSLSLRTADDVFQQVTRALKD